MKIYSNRFKDSEEFEEILEELTKNGTLNGYAYFRCLSDGIMIYSNECGGFAQEFHIIADCDFEAEMIVEDLLNLKRVKYFEHVVYIDKKRAGSKCWNIKNASSDN